MLQSIRDRFTGPIIWVIIGLITVPFAIWGIQSFQTGGEDPVIAKVGGVKITQAQFHNAYEQYYRQLQALQGENFRADAVDPVATRELVLNNMISRVALDQYARKAGYRLDDAALRQFLETVPQFQDHGHFSAQRYREALLTNGMTPEIFEAQQRERLPKEQVRDAVLDSTFVAAEEARQAWRLEHQQRSFSYVKFAPEKYMAAIAVTDAQVKQHYEDNKASYQAPERIKLSYIELAAADFPPAPAPSAEVLKALYDAQKASMFSTPEERHASHILVSFGADKAAAKAKAEALYDKLQHGADFATLAKESSDDPGSKTKGGDLGWVKRGALTPKFEAALFGLKPGEISKPVETEFGWHLIRLDELKPAKIAEFDDPEVQQRLLASYRQKDAAQRFADESQQLDQLAFENPNSLETAAKALKLEPKTTDWFTRQGGAGIAANPAVIAAAFSREVAQDGENSKPVAIDPARVVVIRKAEYQAPRQLDFAEVADKVREQLKDSAAKAKAGAEADALLAAITGGVSFDGAVKAQNLTLVSPPPATRDAKDLDKAMLEALFAMPRPGEGKPSLRKLGLDNGEVAVLALQKVGEDGTPPAPGTPEFQKQQGELRDAQAGAELDAFRVAMEAQLKITRKAEPATEEPAAR